MVGSTGCVVSPYIEYPQLLGVLLRMLSEGTPSTRREVMKVRRGCWMKAACWMGLLRTLPVLLLPNG